MKLLKIINKFDRENLEGESLILLTNMEVS